MSDSDTALAEVTWNLDDLLEGDHADPEAAVTALLDEAEKASEKFAAEYEGKVSELDGPGLIVAMTKLADISDRAGRALNYAHLRFAADTADPANGALLQMGSERATRIQTQLLFFDLEWAALDDEVAEALLATPGLEFCEHHLMRAGSRSSPIHSIPASASSSQRPAKLPRPWDSRLITTRRAAARSWRSPSTGSSENAPMPSSSLPTVSRWVTRPRSRSSP